MLFFAAQDSRDVYGFLIFVILKNEIPRRRRRRRRRWPPPPQEGQVGPKLPRMLFSIGVIGDGDYDDDDDDDDDEIHDDHENDDDDDDDDHDDAMLLKNTRVTKFVFAR